MVLFVSYSLFFLSRSRLLRSKFLTLKSHLTHLTAAWMLLVIIYMQSGLIVSNYNCLLIEFQFSYTKMHRDEYGEMATLAYTHTLSPPTSEHLYRGKITINTNWTIQCNVFLHFTRFAQKPRQKQHKIVLHNNKCCNTRCSLENIQAKGQTNACIYDDDYYCSYYTSICYALRFYTILLVQISHFISLARYAALFHLAWLIVSIHIRRNYG